MADKKIPLLIIAGPTAVGKSALAMELAEKLNTDIISCDSAQIYRYMDIGTAKPTPEERKRVCHRLVDYVNPDEDYSAVRYKNDCDAAIKELVQNGKTPILCGGTGMYFNAVLYDMNFGNSYKSEEVRQELSKILKNDGYEKLYGMLCEIDPETAKILHPNDTVRIIRAIEIFRVSGMKKSEIRQDYKNSKRYDFLFAVLNTDRETLYERINKRVDEMVGRGLAGEVERLKNMGYGGCKSMQAIGYKEMLGYLNGSCSLEKAVQDIKRFSRNYAKRQITWFKGVNGAVWYDALKDRNRLAEDILKRYFRLTRL